MLLGGSAASVCLGFWLTTTAVTIPAAATTTSMTPPTSYRGRSLGRRRRRGGAGAGRACDSGWLGSYLLPGWRRWIPDQGRIVSQHLLVKLLQWWAGIDA